jgi:thiol-disulfide isomerase/thioredoxin
MIFILSQPIKFVKDSPVNLEQFRKFKKVKMIATILISVAILSIIIWNNLINREFNNIKIPESNNKTYNTIEAISPSDIVSEIENNRGNPILLYIYTTWCGVCKKQLPVINDIAQKFQNTDLKVIAVAIDQNIDGESFKNYLQTYQNIYFQPKYLLYRDGIQDLLLKKNIKYSKKIPFTILLDRNSNVEFQSAGYKSKKFLNYKIIQFYK